MPTKCLRDESLTFINKGWFLITTHHIAQILHGDHTIWPISALREQLCKTVVIWMRCLPKYYSMYTICPPGELLKPFGMHTAVFTFTDPAAVRGIPHEVGEHWWGSSSWPNVGHICLYTVWVLTQTVCILLPLFLTLGVTVKANTPSVSW